MSLYSRLHSKIKDDSICRKKKLNFIYFMVGFSKNILTRIAIRFQTSEVFVGVLQTCVHLTKKKILRLLEGFPRTFFFLDM